MRITTQAFLLSFTVRALFPHALCASPAQVPACQTCHPAEAKLHAQSAHASALLPVPRSRFAEEALSGARAGVPLKEAANGYAITYRSSPSGLLAKAERGSDEKEGLIQWVFGSGRRGQTPLILVDNRYLEHRVSFYVETEGFGITTGQDNGPSRDAFHALGIPQTDSDLKSCLGCHSSGSIAELASFQPGVQCQRCHTGANEHAAGHGKPVNPGKLEHVAQVQLCGGCHRVAPQPGHDNETSNVRFQPLRLMKSRCYTEGTIACTTCHAAHRDARTSDPDYYNGKCASCHGAETKHIAEQGSGNCIRCHMPRRQPAPQLAFTDHWIRVVRGEGSTVARAR